MADIVSRQSLFTTLSQLAAVSAATVLAAATNQRRPLLMYDIRKFQAKLYCTHTEINLDNLNHC